MEAKMAYRDLNNMHGMNFPKPLTNEETLEYLELLKDGNNNAKNKLVEHNLRLVAYIARKFFNTGVDIEDLISIGTIGLIKAINTFDIDKEIRLASYASRCIENEILMYLRKASRIKMEVHLEDVLTTDSAGEELHLSDTLNSGENIEEDYIINEQLEELKDSIGVLDERAQEIINMRYFSNDKPLTQKQLAEKIDICQSYISRIETRAINALVKRLEGRGYQIRKRTKQTDKISLKTKENLPNVEEQKNILMNQAL